MQERQRKLAEDQRNLVQQQSQAKAQMLRYEDELARKRMQVPLLAYFSILHFTSFLFNELNPKNKTTNVRIFDL